MKIIKVRVDNLRKMLKHIVTVPRESFDMKVFNKDFNGMVMYLRREVFRDRVFEPCGSVACFIGHCVILDKALMNNITENYNNAMPAINHFYVKWSEIFTGIPRYTVLWEWCFGYEWSEVEDEKTIEAAVERIAVLLNGTLTNHPAYEKFLERMKEYEIKLQPLYDEDGKPTFHCNSTL